MTMDAFGMEVSMQQWNDEDSGDYFQVTTFDGFDQYQENTVSMTGYDDMYGDHAVVQLESIQQMSDYLYYSLDSWGRENSASLQPQCGEATDCFGAEYSSEKCCAAISMSEGPMGAENMYSYRCLDMGMLGMNMAFSLGDGMKVNIQCDGAVGSGAMALAATVTAAAAAMATVF